MDKTIAFRVIKILKNKILPVTTVSEHYVIQKKTAVYSGQIKNIIHVNAKELGGVTNKQY